MARSYLTRRGAGGKGISWPVLKLPSWTGVLATLAIVAYIEGLRQSGASPPIPFLLLYGALVLTATTGGMRAGLASAAIAAVFIGYSALISFGPSMLTGGPLQVALGVVLVFATAILLGRTKDQVRAVMHALQETSQETRFLYSTALVAAYTESFDDALQQCLDLVCGYVGWPVGHLYVPAPDETRDLRPTSVWHLDDARAFGAFRDLTERTTFRRGEGLPGRVLVSGEPAWIVDVQEDDNFPRKPAAKEVGLRAAFGFPIKLGEDTVAVLEFFTTEAMPAETTILDVMPIVGTQIGRVLERERAREALVQQAEDLKQSNAELEAFSYSVSHDLRAPLRAMDGFSRILVEDYAPQLPEEAQHYLQVVRDNAKGMGELVDDLLAFSRLGRQPVHKLAIDPRPIVDEVLRVLRAEQDGRAVEIDIAELPECQADPALLKQVFANLLSNALKFTRKCDPAKIEVGSEQRDREIVYFVRDNGAGFDMQYADKLFGVFQRLHRVEEYEGTGVGLAIVRRIVERHGGRVWATATVDQGATFSFTLERGEANG